MVPHTVIVHFAIALLVTSALCDLLAALAEEAELRVVAYWTLLFGTAATALAVLSGYSAASIAQPVDEGLRMVNWHRNSGLAVLAGALPVAVWRFRAGSRAPDHPLYWLLTGITIVAVFVTAYFGGTAVYRHGVGVFL